MNKFPAFNRVIFVIVVVIVVLMLLSSSFIAGSILIAVTLVFAGIIKKLTKLKIFTNFLEKPEYDNGVFAANLEGEFRMNKFPVLTTYRMIYSLIGWLIVIGGVYVAYETNYTLDFYGDRELNVPGFLLISGIAFFIGGTMIIVAEIVNVFLRIEDHLEVMRKASKGDSRSNWQSQSAKANTNITNPFD